MSLSVISEFDDALQPQDDVQSESVAEMSEHSDIGMSELPGTNTNEHSEAELLADLLPDDEVIPERLSDARADVPISETSERFLRALLAKVPIDRIEELYLFAPLRQGAVETGIAVVAARVNAAIEAPVVLDANVASVPGQANAESADDSIHEPVIGESVVDDAAMVEVQTEVQAVDAGVSNETETVAHEATDDSPYAPDPDTVVATEDAADEFVPTEEIFEYHPPVRHTVYTARYRLVVKGPDRGKWEIDVVDEADAPLLTVETVVRGVQRRAGEETATVRYTAAQLVRALRLDPLNTP